MPSPPPSSAVQHSDGERAETGVTGGTAETGVTGVTGVTDGDDTPLEAHPASLAPLPRLAVVFDDNGFSPFEIRQAAAGWCDLVWLVRWSPQPLLTQMRFLSRLGEVVDAEGLEMGQIAEELRRRSVGGVIAFTDPPLEVAAELATLLGLRFHSRRTARQLTDKLAQRNALAAGGLPGPKFLSVPAWATHLSELPAEAPLPLPVVAKPRQGWGSRDTVLIDTPSALREFLGRARPEGFVLEEYLADRPSPTPALGAAMVSVESVVIDGVVHHVAVTGRFPLAAPFRETGSYLPSDLAGDERAGALEMASAAARALGVEHGVLHTEIKVTPDGPRIIEVNGRIGGGIPMMLGRIGGLDLLATAMRMALGCDIGPIPTEGPSGPVGFFLWIHGPDHSVELVDVNGVEGIRVLPGVSEVRVNKHPGDLLNPAVGGAGHVLAVEGSVADHRELGELMGQISATLSLSYGPSPTGVCHSGLRWASRVASIA